MKIIDRYILKAHAGPFLFAFFTITFVFILSFLTKFIDRFVGKGIEFPVMLEMIFLQSAWMVGLAAPMSVLVATVMAFGTMTNNSEMTVMRAGGVSLPRLMLPVLICGFLLTGMIERFNNVLLPEANYQAKALLSDVTRTKPSFGLTENAFSNVINGYSILVRKTDEKSQELKGVVIYDMTRPGFKTLVTAARGKVEFTPDSQYLIMTLYNGEIHEIQVPGLTKYRKMLFDKHRFVFESAGYGFERTEEGSVRRGDRELSSDDLLAIGKDFMAHSLSTEQKIAGSVLKLRSMVLNSHSKPEPAASPAPALTGNISTYKTARAIEYTDRVIGRLNSQIESMETDKKMHDMYMVEYHKKYAISFACVVFVLIGAPLGVLARRGGFGVGAGFSLAFFVFYWILIIAGEKISDRGLLDPGLSVWLANIVLTVIGLIMLFRMTRSVSGSSR